MVRKFETAKLQNFFVTCLVYNANQLSHIAKSGKKIVKAEDCYVAVQSLFDYFPQHAHPKHNCCNFCSESCFCIENGCPVTYALKIIQLCMLRQAQIVNQSDQSQKRKVNVLQWLLNKFYSTSLPVRQTFLILFIDCVLYCNCCTLH